LSFTDRGIFFFPPVIITMGNQLLKSHSFFAGSL